MDKINQDTLNPIESKLNLLKEQFPEIFEDSKLNIDKLKAIVDNEQLSNNEKFEFNWAGKNEIGNILKSSSGASLKFDKENSFKYEDTENLLIEGDNLEVLKLLQKSYFGKIKMIYIDPPYNTGNGFVYNDNFKDNLKKYLVDTNQIDDDGNNTNLKQDRVGRNHSNWLNFMYPRLYLARNLLKEDGVIFISIDDNEVHHLKMICNEIFGEENFVGQFVVISAPAGTQSSSDVAQQHSYCLEYKRSEKFNSIKFELTKEELKIKYPLVDKFGHYNIERLWKRGMGGRKEDVPSLHFPVFYNEKTNEIFIDDELNDVKNLIKIIPYQTTGVLGRWTWSKKKMINEKDLLVVKKVAGDYKLHKKRYIHEETGNLINSIIKSNIARTELGSLETKNLMNAKVFDYPKYTKFIEYFISSSTNSNDIILDFFAGSGTTGHAVMDLNKDGGNRKFILVQYPEKTDEKSIAKKEGYNTIFEITKARLLKAIEKNDYNSGFKTFRLCDSNYKKWNEIFNQKIKEEKTKTLLNQINQFESSLIDNFKVEDVLYEIILKEGFTLNCEINIKKIGKNNFYLIEENEMKFYLNLDKKLDENTIEELKKLKGENIFLLDESLDDNSKINLEKYVNLTII